MPDEILPPPRPTFSHGQGNATRPEVVRPGRFPKRKPPPSAGACPVEPTPKPKPLTPALELIDD